jgi:hypothetical protein
MFVAALLAAGCTAANPAFGEGSEGASGGTTAASEAEPGTTSGPGGASDTGALEGASTQGSTSSDPQTTDGESSDVPPPDVEPVCVSTDTEISMTLTFNGAPIDTCVPDVPSHGSVTGFADGVLSFVGCNSCERCFAGSPAYTLELGGIPLPSVFDEGSCIAISPSFDEATCGIDSLSISRRVGDDDWEPLVIAVHDAFTVKEALPLVDLQIGWAERVCEGAGCEEAGEYALGFGNASYGASTMVSDVPLFESEFAFDLEVKTAHVDAECEPQVAWLASLHAPR